MVFSFPNKTYSVYGSRPRPDANDDVWLRGVDDGAIVSSILTTTVGGNRYRLTLSYFKSDVGDQRQGWIWRIYENNTMIAYGDYGDNTYIPGSVENAEQKLLEFLDVL